MIGDTSCSEKEARERWSNAMNDWADDVPKSLRMIAADLISRLYNDPYGFIGHKKDCTIGREDTDDFGNEDGIKGCSCGYDQMGREVQEFECNCEVLMNALGCPDGSKHDRWG